MDNNNLRNPGVPYANGGVPEQPVAQAPTPLFADVARSTPQASSQPIAPPLVATPIATTPQAPTPLPPATPPSSSQPIANPLPPKPKKPRDWRRIVLTITFSGLFLLFIGAGWLIFEAVRNSDNETSQVNNQIASTSIPLSEFASSGSLNLLGTQSLAVNGQLRANESFVLAPQVQPGKTERGQLYFDANTNQLAYYNGSQFIQIPGDEESVLTLQGQTGNITLVGGAGLAVTGTTLTNTGVTSLAGLTADVTLGGGLSVVNGTIANSGIVGAAGGTGISVVNDGAGNITISNTGSGTGTVTSPNGTAGRIAKFTGVQTIEDSLLSETGSTVTVNGSLSVTGTTTLSTALGVNSGGTGATSFTANGVIVGNGSGALTAVAAAGVGECLMSTAGAPSFQSCPGGSGGVTSLNSLTGALTIANASTGGSTITINDASTSQKGIAQFNSTNFSAASGVVNTIQNINVAATPTFGTLTLTSSQATSPMLLVNNTNASGTGNLIDLQLNGTTRMSVSPAGAMTVSGAINGQTISNLANFTGSLTVAGAANLNGGASVTGTLTANTITPSGAMTVGATGQSLTLQGNASTTLNAVNGGNTSTLSFQTPTANVNYRLLTATAGTYDICTTAANCVGVGGSVTTPGGTTNRIPKFTGAQTLGDSIISDNGTTVSIGGVLAVNTITPTGALTIGATSQALTLQGTATSISSTDSGITNTLSFATPAGGNKTIIVPNASGTVVVSASGPLAIDGSGNITCATCATGSNVTSLNGLSGALSLAYATGSGSTVTIQDASTSQKGVAQFNSTNFSVTSGNVNTIQDIGVAATPTFGRLTVTSSQASNAMLLINNTNAGATGNLLDVQLNGTSRLAVTPAGAMTLTGTLNGQTISSAANLTGTLTVASTTTINGAANLTAGATVTGTLAANTITPSSALTVGATNQSFLMQGNASSTITATSGASTTSVAFQTPTASVTYRLLTAAAGTYDICTTVGNCAGVGGGVTTAGGTTNQLAKFTGSNAIGDSIISDNGTTVTIGGTLAVNTITPSAAMTIGATSQNLTLQGAVTTLSSTNGGITNSLVFATPSGSNKTITVPNATGTVAVSATGPLSIDSAGNVTCATCVTSGGGGGGVGAVDSLNGLTGALTIANASTGGSTITIDNASTSAKGIAQFNSTNFSASSGTINTIQNINTTAAPTFGQLTITSSQASNAMLLVNNTNVSATGNLIDLQLNGTSRMAVTPAGAMTLTGTLNGQTISSSANFTGTLAVTGTANLNGGATVTGTLTANTITPSGSLTVGATTQSFLVQGNASSTITATNGANTTTIGFQSPTAAVTYRFLTAAAGTYDVCTTVGNCAGVGGGVTTPGGTTGTIAKFTASGTIGDSILTESGTTITVGGTLAANTAVQAPLFDTATATALNIGTTNATAINLNKDTTVATGVLSLGSASQAASLVLYDGTSNTATLQLANLSSNRAITFGDEAGTVCLQNSSNCGFALSSGSGNYIQNQSASDQTADFRISGTGRANTSVTTPLLDSISGALNVGTTNATAINLNKSTTVSGNLNQSTGTFSLASNGNGSITTAGLLTVTAATSSTWSVTTGTLTLQAGTGNAMAINGSTNNINLNTGASGTITVGSSGTTTVNVGAQTDDARTVNIGYPSAATNAQTINIGANSAAGAITVRSGTGNITLNSGSGTIGLQGATTVTGNLTTTGDVAVNGGDITSSATTLTLSATSYVNLDSAVGFIFKNGGNNRAYINGQNGRLEVYAANSFGGMTINASSGNSAFTVAGDNSEVTIGYSDNIGTLLILDTKTDAGDPAAFNGSMYYNSNAGKFRCYEASAWKDCITASVSSATLQSAYTNSTNPEITLDATRGALTVRDASTPLGANLLEIQNNAGSTTYLAVAAAGTTVGNPLTVQPTASDGASLLVKSTAGNNVFTVDTSTSRVGIGLGGTSLPSLANGGIEVNGALRLSGSGSSFMDTYNTPAGSSVNSKIVIPNQDPGGFGQLIALGLPSTAQLTARALSLFDARTAAHQPTIGVFSPDENNLFGFSWEGSNTNAYIKTTGSNLILRNGTTDLMTLLSGGNVGIGVSPSYKLDVAGSVNVSSGNTYKINGTDICSASGCTAASGSSNYVQNGTSVQTANMAIESAADGSRTLVVRARASQTAETLRVESNGGTSQFAISAAGAVSIANGLTVGTFAGAGLTDCDASNSKLLWDTTSSQFSCGTDRASVTIRKAADETVTTNTTAQNDDDFFFSVGANETWAFQMFFEVNGSAAADWRAQIDAPTSSTCRVAYNNVYNNTNTYTSSCGNAGENINDQGDTFDNSYVAYGTVVTGANAGTVRLKWAQGTSSGSTILRGGGQMIAYKISGADLAEAYYTNDQSVTPGDVVEVDGSLRAGVKKTSGPYSRGSLGIVSTKPGLILGEPHDALSNPGKPVLLALNGRVPVKVSLENGNIRAGDYLTASSTPGVAMKATKPGQIIGTALEDYAGSNTVNGIGSTMVFVNPGWATPDNSGLQVGAQDSDLQGQMAGNFASMNVDGKLTVKDTLTVDPENKRITVGPANGDDHGTILVLGNRTKEGDPDGAEGAMYYNAASRSFRCFSSGTWDDCGGGRYVQTNQGSQANNAPPSGNIISATSPTPFAETYKVPAGDCTPGRSYRITAGGVYSAAQANTGYSAALTWGGTTIATNAATTPAAENEAWTLTAVITCYKNFNGAMAAETSGTISWSSATDSAKVTNLRNGQNGQAIQTANAQNLNLTMGWSTPGNTMTLRTFIVEAIGSR